MAQFDNIGSGRAIKFDGVNDYVDLGNILDDLDYPFTISSWINIPADGGGPIFASQDNDGIYNGFWFFVLPNRIWLEYGDGRGENKPEYRRGKSVTGIDMTDRWVHVCGVVKGLSSIELYLNGQNITGSYIGNSSLPMASNYPNDVAKIGHFYSNGITYRFKGSIDDVRIWNKALTQSEIRANMSVNLSGTEQGLIGYWSFNELNGNTIVDQAQSIHNGVLVNDPQRGYSGAAIGDQSIHVYRPELSGNEFAVEFPKSVVSVLNITSDPDGFQVYVVNSKPTQINGLTGNNLEENFYYGVYNASIYPGATFQTFLLDRTPDGVVPSCSLFSRVDNSDPQWNYDSSAITQEIARVEVVQQYSDLIAVDLGEDQVVCPLESILLGPANVPDNYEFVWNDGSNSRVHIVDHYGAYWVTIKDGCTIGSDTILFTKPPLDTFAIDLGTDIIVCPLEPVVLSPNIEFGNYQFLWQDGSSSPRMQVDQYGTYWVKIQDECTIGVDTIAFIKPSMDTISISLGPDSSVCLLEPIMLGPVVDSNDYQFLWQDGSSSQTLKVEHYGTYWLTIFNDCEIGSDTILFSKPEEFSGLIPNVFTPNGDAYNRYFEIDNALIGSRLAVYDRWGKQVFESTHYDNDWDGGGLPSGIYFYRIESQCFEPKKGWLSILY